MAGPSPLRRAVPGCPPEVRALLPVLPGSKTPGSTGALAGGRHVRALCWTGPSTLLVLATPVPGQGAETGNGDVLVEYEVAWPKQEDGGEGPCDPCEDGLPHASAGTAVRQLAVTHTGGPCVLRITAQPGGGGALVQMSGGEVRQYVSGGRLVPCGPHASFPAPCPWMLAAPLPRSGSLVRSCKWLHRGFGVEQRGWMG